MPEQPSPRETLADVMQYFTMGDAEIVRGLDDEEWEAMIERTDTPGCIHQIREETYDHFLGVLPPKWQTGTYFAFAEGQEPLTLFWMIGMYDHYCRRLTDDETEHFCRASGLPLNYGSY